MPLTPPDRDRVLGALEEAAGEFSGLLRAVEDPSARAVGHWSVLQTAKHTSHLYELFPTLLEGGTSPVEHHRKLAETWERLLDGDEEDDLDRIAGRIDAGAERFLGLASRVGWDETFNWHGDLKVPGYTLACILINEAIIHGRDVAGTAGRPWRIDPDHARHAIRGLLPVLPHFLRKDTVATMDVVYELRVRGSTPVFITIQGGTMSFTRPEGRPVDCRISVDAVDYLLIGYGRKQQLGPILTGKVVAYGRKPWLGLKFGKLFESV
ncbi:MAG: hypothetical protein ACRDLB_07390 [Actinomycetota bacterium]